MSGQRFYVWKRWGRGLLGECYFRFSQQSHTDILSGEVFDAITLSNILVTRPMKRKGIGTAIVKMLASKYEEALIEGERASQEAIL